MDEIKNPTSVEAIDPDVAELNVINAASEENRNKQEALYAEAAQRASQLRRAETSKWYWKLLVKIIGLGATFALSYKLMSIGWIQPEVFLWVAHFCVFGLGVLFGANWSRFFKGGRR
jgi:hypothetical protein